MASIDGPPAGAGVTTSFTYKAAGYLATVTDALAHLTQVTAHTASGLPLTVVDQNGVTTTLAYDPRDRLLSRTVASGQGNVTRERRTIEAQVYDTDYVYDLADNLTQAVYPSGRIVSYARGSLGRVTAATTQEIAAAPVVNVATAISYKPFGPVAALTHGSGPRDSPTTPWSA